MCGVWACGEWRVACGVWCVVMVSGVWCVVCGVVYTTGCVVCGVWRVACAESRVASREWRVACGVWRGIIMIITSTFPLLSPPSLPPSSSSQLSELQSLLREKEAHSHRVKGSGCGSQGKGEWVWLTG